MRNEFKGLYFQMKSEIIEAYLFLRKENITIPSETLEFMKDAAIEKLDSVLEKSETGESNCTIDSVRQRILGWWETLPENMNGEYSKYQLAYKYYDRHWMSLTYREIENIYGQYVA